MLYYGINPVLEALRAGRVQRVRASAGAGDRVRQLTSVAAEQGIPVEWVPAGELDRLTRGAAHQGIVADSKRAEEWTIEHLVENARGAPLLLVLDGVEDPQNVGAILRTADAAGVDGVVRQTRRAAALGSAAAKASAGALAHVRIASVVNVARALEDLKAGGVWTVGLAAEASQPYDRVDLTLPTAVVVGAEGSGLRRLVRERCDWLVSVPMAGHVASLNVSVATAIVLFEAVRQRRVAGGSRN